MTVTWQTGKMSQTPLRLCMHKSKSAPFFWTGKSTHMAHDYNLTVMLYLQKLYLLSVHQIVSNEEIIWHREPIISLSSSVT